MGRRRHHRPAASILIAAALPSGMELLHSLAISVRGLEVVLGMSSWSARNVLRRGEALTTWDIAEDLIDGLERRGLCSCCHLLTLQAIVEFLCLLMFAVLLSVCCYEILILGLEPVLVYLHV